MLWLAAALVAGVLGVGGHEDAPPAGTLEGRPAPGAASSLQSRVDAAPAGATVVVEPGIYAGDLTLDRPIRLVGRGRPKLLGSGTGSVVRIRADGVTVAGFDIDGRGGGDLGRDSSGIHIAAHRAHVRGCRIVHSLFGIYLREADGSVIEDSVVEGIPGKDPGEKGSGIHVWNTHGFRIERCLVTEARDGFYIQSSTGGLVRGNTARDLRYGLHYMFSDDNAFYDNTFENSAAGAALMYSRRLTFRHNRFVHNRGFASVGLLLKACDNLVAEDNLIADNARGIFLEGSYDNVFRGNVIAASDDGVVLYDSCARNRFTGNSFLANLSPLQLVGRRTDTVFAGNYWSDNAEPDLDGDGRSDRPYRLSSVFDHIRGNLTAADLMAQGPAAMALAAAEEAFPVLEAVPVEDPSPLARPPAAPVLADVRGRGEHGRPRLSGILASVALLGAGAFGMAAGRRRA